MDERIKEAIEYGSDLTGGAISGLIGTMLFGPAGGVIGGISGVAVSKVLNHIGNEIVNKQLAPREQVRVGATFAFALSKISNKIQLGEKLRSDGFFDNTDGDRSSAEEILDGILISSQKEHEEKKIKYLGNLYANIAFDSSKSKSDANMLISLADSLTYRQFCIINLIGNKKRYKLYMNNYHKNYTVSTEKLDFAIVSLLGEIFDLYNRNLIANSDSAMLGLTDINPSLLEVRAIGAELYNLMQLSEIPIPEIDTIARILEIDPSQES